MACAGVALPAWSRLDAGYFVPGTGNLAALSWCGGQPWRKHRLAVRRGHSVGLTPQLVAGPDLSPGRLGRECEGQTAQHPGFLTPGNGV